MTIARPLSADYLNLDTAEFRSRIEQLENLLEPCRLCPRECRVSRRQNKVGFCRTGIEFRVASYTLHYGEEPPISGWRGSGTIFFSRCNLTCLYCQNYPISHLGHGEITDVTHLATMMLELQQQGAHNINLVTPTHIVPQIVCALFLAREKGLHLPLVYNCGGYESLNTLRLLSGIINIYMPDAKYSQSGLAKLYSNAEDYPSVNRLALKEMFQQVGQLKLDKDGIASRGLLVRHLVLPGNLPNTKGVLEFLAGDISPRVYLSLMAQYHPANQSNKFPQLSRRLNAREYQQAVRWADRLGLVYGWRQEL